LVAWFSLFLGADLFQQRAYTIAMSDTFSCSACGASLTFDGGSETSVQCPYCGSTVVVPQELRPAPPSIVQTIDPEEIEIEPPELNEEQKKTLSRATILFIAFIVVVVVLPTCVGLIASFFGVIVSILATVGVTILSFFIGK
jgi:DNA-directed RNA polymerase subunit RPC12/RpoP